ncbi:MAG: HIT domain-containing protein [Deltaproteobacteria bacterium]|nr:HIT domain-containing protein [Deltaproteobacteria bacterium]
MEYIKDSVREPPQTCVFCALASPGDDRERLVLYRGRKTFVLMNKYPYNNGHLLVLPLTHAGRLDALDPETFTELHQTLLVAVTVLQKILEPHAMNVGMNLGPAAGAGIPDHLHYHVVPRWSGDTNFMPVLSETKIISQHIRDTYDQLEPGFRV